MEWTSHIAPGVKFFPGRWRWCFGYPVTSGIFVNTYKKEIKNSVFSSGHRLKKNRVVILYSQQISLARRCIPLILPLRRLIPEDCESRDNLSYIRMLRFRKNKSKGNWQYVLKNFPIITRYSLSLPSSSPRTHSYSHVSGKQRLWTLSTFNYLVIPDLM